MYTTISIKYACQEVFMELQKEILGAFNPVAPATMVQEELVLTPTSISTKKDLTGATKSAEASAEDTPKQTSPAPASTQEIAVGTRTLSANYVQVTATVAGGAPAMAAMAIGTQTAAIGQTFIVNGLPSSQPRR
jgi:hypothetical protein